MNPAAYLPHRFPFQMLDTITSLEKGHSASALKRVTSFPGGFPQILLIECIAQTAGIAAAHEEGEGGFLASIDHAEFHGIAREGDSLTVSARVLKTFGRLSLVEGDVGCEGKTLLKARMTLGIGKL